MKYNKKETPHKVWLLEMWNQLEFDSRFHMKARVGDTAKPYALIVDRLSKFTTQDHSPIVLVVVILSILDGNSPPPFFYT
ncbi:unnamed protein product [Linum trigynum]|uniref:Uncharacterized protein n=1 Tax=Linum trigynum TaxID=586398 RepID=A0AAV2E848_9ROSI